MKQSLYSLSLQNTAVITFHVTFQFMLIWKQLASQAPHSFWHLLCMFLPNNVFSDFHYMCMKRLLCQNDSLQFPPIIFTPFTSTDIMSHTSSSVWLTQLCDYTLFILANTLTIVQLICTGKN